MELASSGNDHETLQRLAAENNALYQDLVLLQEDRSYLQSVITVYFSRPPLLKCPLAKESLLWHNSSSNSSFMSRVRFRA